MWPIERLLLFKFDIKPNTLQEDRGNANVPGLNIQDWKAAFFVDDICGLIQPRLAKIDNICTVFDNRVYQGL
jgi:hypothetical protein